MKKVAVIVAGGSGLRMGTEMPKQFLLLNEKPILWHTMEAFFKTFSDIKIVLVLPQQHISLGEELKIMFSESAKNIEIVAGGLTRFESVKNGLKLIQSNTIVFVHDGVRCLITNALIKRCYYQAMELGSAIPVIAATDSIRISENAKHKVADRNTIKLVQTPQTFVSDILLNAFAKTYQESFTDEATVVEASGKNVYLIDGEYDNIKITRPIDLVIAEQILNKRKNG